MQQMQRNFGLDLARAIAIGAVVLGHHFEFLSPFASMGVELFFVLSGYLIGGILLKSIEKNSGMNLSSLFDFLKRRWFRTVPNYFLFLIINFLCFKFIFTENNTPKNFYYFFFFIQNLAWPRSGFFGESWSLCVEEWFYLTLPISYFLAQKLNWKKAFSPKKLFLIIAISYLAIPFFLRQFFAIGTDEERYIVIYRLDSIMYGVIFAYIKNYHSFIWQYHKKILTLSFLGVIPLIVFMYLKETFSNLAHLQFFTLAPIFMSLSLPFFDSLKDVGIPKIITKWITNISLWSYSLYLVHLPVLLTMKRIILIDQNNASLTLLFRLICLGISIYISKYLYIYFEIPTTQLRDRKSTI